MSSRGFLLLEVTVAYVILALALVVLVPAFILGLKANKRAEQIQQATYLSRELIEEIRLRKWDENTSSDRSYTAAPSNTLGREAGESATDKTAFDDVDDFNGWTESPIKDPMNQSLSGFPSYTRTATVQYVDSAMTVSAASTDYKKVTVCTTAPIGQSICLSTLLINH